MRCAPKSDLNLIRSCLPHLGESWSAASGDFSGRDLVGRSPRSDRIRTRVPQTGGSRAGRRAKPEPNRYGGLRFADEQRQVGQSSGQCDALAPLDRASKGFCCQCLTSREPGQGAALRSHWEITPSSAWAGALWNRCRARSVGIRPTTRSSGRLAKRPWGFSSGIRGRRTSCSSKIANQRRPKLLQPVNGIGTSS